MSDYIDLGLQADAEEIRQDAREFMLDQAPAGFVITPLVDWIISAIARMASLIIVLAGRVPRAIIQTVGETLLKIPVLEATSATGTVTFTAVDTTGGYIIPAGAQVVIDDVAFETTIDATITPGNSTVEVPAVAVLPGPEGNDLIGDAELVSPTLVWVDSVEITGQTLGGQDGETVDDYVERFADETPTLSTKAILIQDFEALARRDLEVTRALAIDNLNATTGDAAAEGHVTVVIADAAGGIPSVGAHTRVEEALEADRVLGIVVHVIDATYTPLSVTFTYTLRAGYDETATTSEAEAAVADFLDPARWGVPPDGDVDGWENDTTVDLGSLEAAILAVPGVRRVTDISVLYFDDSFTASDLSAYTVDAGAGTLTPSGGQLVPSSTAEKRIARTGLLALNPRGVIEYATGATVGTIGVVGLILKRLDNDDYLFVRWSDTDDVLAVRKSVAGVTSTISSDASTNALSANTTYWMRGWISGNVVTVEHWTTNPALGGTPADTYTYTLTGADATTYGAGVPGGVGARVQPGSTTWRYNSLKFDSVDEDVQLVGPAALPQADVVTGTAV